MENEVRFKIELGIINDYIDTINNSKETIKEIKEKRIAKIEIMNSKIKELLEKYKKEKRNIYISVITQIMDANNGMISTRLIEPININRCYLSLMKKMREIEKISRGIYLSSNTFEDSYFSFQQKYKKIIFSHMNALYFHGLTEEFPYNYTITVPQKYHVKIVNKKCNVFYVSEKIYDLGITEIKTPYGNKVRVYDKERCICDIIRSKKRLDIEQVKKVIKNYMKCNDKDLVKLSLYSKKMGIREKVMEMVGD